MLRANGLGDPELGEVFDCYRRAAEGGIAAAEVVLALRARTGFERPGGRDPQQALEWCRRADERGMRFAVLLRALLILEGAAGPPDLKLARALRKRAETLALPRPALSAFVDPGYRGDVASPEPVEANAVLEGWRQEVERRLGAVLNR